MISGQYTSFGEFTDDIKQARLAGFKLQGVRRYYDVLKRAARNEGKTFTLHIVPIEKIKAAAQHDSATQVVLANDQSGITLYRYPDALYVTKQTSPNIPDGRLFFDDIFNTAAAFSAAYHAMQGYEPALIAYGKSFDYSDHHQPELVSLFGRTALAILINADALDATNFNAANLQAAQQGYPPLLQGLLDHMRRQPIVSTIGSDDMLRPHVRGALILNMHRDVQKQSAGLIADVREHHPGMLFSLLTTPREGQLGYLREHRELQMNDYLRNLLRRDEIIAQAELTLLTFGLRDDMHNAMQARPLEDVLHAPARTPLVAPTTPTVIRPASWGKKDDAPGP